jgi:hypothetical protein
MTEFRFGRIAYGARLGGFFRPLDRPQGGVRALDIVFFEH